MLCAAPNIAVVALADPPPPPSYVDALQRAYDLIQNASPPDSLPAEEALPVLGAGTGHSQPEIILDLATRPPRYDDARRRLTALLDALRRPATTADPALAQERLHQVMSMSRYDPLHRPPSLWERIQQWIQDRIAQLLRLLSGGSGGAQPPLIWFYAAGLLVVLTIAVQVIRASRGRFGQSLGLPDGGPRPPADWFAQADVLASRGDRVGAIRALCAAVAATLAGERSWEGSPLTVREIFQHAPDHASLLPLLLAFEAAVYGGRDVDPATYARAERVANAYRHRAEAAA